MDLKADYDRFMKATEDHLVPAQEGKKDRQLSNLILSCAVCNRLKGNFIPGGLDAVKDRRAYISAVRDYIYKRRGERMKEFTQVTHPEQVEYQ